MKFNIDINSLDLGDTVSIGRCEQILELPYGTIEFAQNQMFLCKWIERELWKAGKQFTVAIKASEIKILTHEESSSYASLTYETGKRKVRLSHRRACAVDLNELTTDRREYHLRLINKMGFVISSMRRHVMPDVTPVERTTPKRR